MTQTDVDKLMPRINLSTVMTGLVLALLGFGGQQVWNLNAQMAEIRQALAIQSAAQQVQSDILKGLGTTYYTTESARADWRLQERENAELRARIEALTERYAEWTGRLSDRVRALEDAARKPTMEHPR